MFTLGVTPADHSGDVKVTRRCRRRERRPLPTPYRPSRVRSGGSMDGGGPDGAVRPRNRVGRSRRRCSKCRDASRRAGGLDASSSRRPVGLGAVRRRVRRDGGSPSRPHRRPRMSDASAAPTGRDHRRGPPHHRRGHPRSTRPHRRPPSLVKGLAGTPRLSPPIPNLRHSRRRHDPLAASCAGPRTIPNLRPSDRQHDHTAASCSSPIPARLAIAEAISLMTA